MDKQSPTRRPARRKLLGGGAALVTGMLGLGFLGKRVGQTEPQQRAAADPPVTAAGAPIELRLYGQNWHIQGEGPRARWARPERGQRQVVFGELLDGPVDAAGATGVKVGELYATCTCVNAPFGAGPLAATFVEQHTLNLGDGTLTGLGTSQGDESTFAIVGGTGRYAGARGSYVARQFPVELGGDGTAELVMAIILDGTA